MLTQIIAQTFEPFEPQDISPLDTVTGTSGDDFLEGTSGNDFMRGLEGDDTLEGYGGSDKIDGGAGDDFLLGEAGNDTLIGGAGNDRIQSGQGADKLVGGGGDDVLSRGPTVDNGPQTMIGGGGDDVLNNGSGDGIYDGGTGIDTLSLMAGGAPMTLSLAEKGPQDSGIGTITLVGIENLYGTNYADYLSGSKDANQIVGEGGDDTLYGAGGADTLTGSQDADTFVYTKVSDSHGAKADLVIVDVDGTGATSDVIDLHAIDANSTKAGNQAFHLVDVFTKHAGELTLKYDSDTGFTTIEADVNGDGRADLAIDVQGNVESFTNFVL